MQFDPFDTVQDTLRMTMGGIDNKNVDTSIDQHFNPFIIVRTNTDCSTDKQFAVFILGSEWIIIGVLDVLDGNQATQFKTVIDNQHTFKTVTVHQAFCILKGLAFLDIHQFFARGHPFTDSNIQLFFKA